MFIKKQFSFITSFIVAIPIMCVVFIPLYFYFSSPNRFILRNTKHLEAVENLSLSENDRSKLTEAISILPPDMECAIYKDRTLLISSFLNIDVSKFESRRAFLDYIQETSKDYYYQLSTVELEGSTAFLVTRITKQNYERPKNRKFIMYILLFLMALVSVCVILLISLSKTVFNSITLIEKQTQDIAQGNLNVEIDTSKKQINEITSISGSLEKMRLSLMEEQNRRNRFIMGISHDLRTPVAIIKGYTEAISDGVISEEEQQQSLTLINAKANQLDGMITTLINFVKLESTDWRQNLSCTSLTELIKEFGHNTQTTCTVFKRNSYIDINLPEEYCVKLDKELVTRAFENLLSNALRYTKENDTISIISFVKEKSVVLKISDTGIGISKEDQNHIFDLFFRGTSSRREEGLGIGLSVVKTIIDTLGWSITVESEPEKGTTFQIIIPV